MPRIVPIQLLKCLKVLLDDNGGILSVGEVKRIAGLMTKYSKKLVSKCIYVQILKCTKTELLGEFMGVGGWTLVYNWLNDAIRAMNWPLVQEILELLLLCPVDVNRLKINSAPKLVKGLCKDGGNEGVRILARRLVEQWLKVVTENTEANAVQQQSITMTPQATIIETEKSVLAATNPAMIDDQVNVGGKNLTNTESKQRVIEQDPLADVEEVPTEPASYSLTAAQKKANESGLVYKIVVKDGQQVLAKVAKAGAPPQQSSIKEEASEDVEKVAEEEADEADAEEQDEPYNTEKGAEAGAVTGEEEDTTSLDKKESESSGDEENVTRKTKKQNIGKSSPERKLDGEMTSEKEKTDKKEQKSTKESKENKENKDRKSDKEKDKERKSSSSSSHRSSSSSHKSSSSSSKSSSSSSSKSKSSSSSSSHRSSSDKHRSSSSSSKDKERKDGVSSSSSKHRSSSSSSKSTSSSSKDRHRDKDKDKSTSSISSVANTSSSSSKRDKEGEKDATSSKDKDLVAKVTSPSVDKLGKIPKKPKDETETEANKATSITIPSKKASMSIEIRRDSEKTKTVKTYKSQFRSHGLTEEAPPPPSRKGLKKPSSTTPLPGTVIPTSLPSSLKRSSPPPRDSPIEKKSKIDINNLSVANEKPGAIKLIAPKKIQTLVETNLFSDALSAATGPKKSTKRKRPLTPSPGQAREGPSPPTSPDAPKVAPLKFYQDTLDESKTEDKSDKDSSGEVKKGSNSPKEDDSNADKENSTEDDDDIPLKKVKEDIEQKVLREQKTSEDGAVIDISSDIEGEEKKDVSDKSIVENEGPPEPKKPGPGCGPNGPPGVLMLHRRKGPKKKLTWRTQEHLEQIRYFELDETERVNVTKTSSFMDMKNMERFSERDAINMSRRGFNHEDNMEPQTQWCALIEVDDVPPHPDGNQSRQRKVQADREQTTLRALYFSHAMIPDSPAEAELEPHMPHDIPVIPLDDITGNPDAVNDFTSMPWPEPKGSPKYGENSLAGTGGLSGLGGPGDMFGSPVSVPVGAPQNPFNPFMSPYANGPGGSIPPQQQQQMQMQMMQGGGGPQQGGWQQPNGGGPMMGPGGNMMGGHFNGSPNMDMGQMGGPGVGPPQQGFMGPFVGPGPAGPPFGPNGPQFGPGGFNGNPNFGPMGQVMNVPMGPGPMMNGGMPHNRNNNSGNWRSGSSNFQDNSRGNNSGGGNWRPAGSGPNRGSGNNGGNNNNGVCKAFIRGHCRLGKSCKFIHPKSKRI